MTSPSKSHNQNQLIERTGATVRPYPLASPLGPAAGRTGARDGR
jgi:hypothetical protein